MIKKLTVSLLLVTSVLTAAQKQSDDRPEANLRIDAKDHGIVLRYGDGPQQCDILGARDVWVFEDNGTYYMHYDAAGPKGWLSSLAVSKDLVNWEKKGPILDFGKAGEDDAAGGRRRCKAINPGGKGPLPHPRGADNPARRPGR